MVVPAWVADANPAFLSHEALNPRYSTRIWYFLIDDIITRAAVLLQYPSWDAGAGLIAWIRSTAFPLLSDWVGWADTCPTRCKWYISRDLIIHDRDLAPQDTSVGRYTVGVCYFEKLRQLPGRSSY